MTDDAQLCQLGKSEEKPRAASQPRRGCATMAVPNSEAVLGKKLLVRKILSACIFTKFTIILKVRLCNKRWLIVHFLSTFTVKVHFYAPVLQFNGILLRRNKKE